MLSLSCLTDTKTAYSVGLTPRGEELRYMDSWENLEVAEACEAGSTEEEAREEMG